MKFMGLGFRAETLGLSWAPRLHPSRLYLQVPFVSPKPWDSPNRGGT